MEEQKLQERMKKWKGKRNLSEHHKGENGEKVKRHLHDS